MLSTLDLQSSLRSVRDSALPPAECPVTNRFAPGIYWREVSIPAGVFAVGHQHKTEHLNVMLSGRVRVLCDGQVRELVAPQVFSSPAGVRKIVLALEPTRWANVHANPTDEHDMDKLEMIFIEKNASFPAHDADMKKLAAQETPVALDPAGDNVLVAPEPGAGGRRL